MTCDLYLFSIVWVAIAFVFWGIKRDVENEVLHVIFVRRDYACGSIISGRHHNEPPHRHDGRCIGKLGDLAFTLGEN